MGRADLKNYYWYHTVDLANGLITPGTYDYREVLDVFQFPKDMKGMSVLDVGSAIGFFAFEFERRGGDVTSLELPSIEDLDRFPGGDIRTDSAKYRQHSQGPGKLHCCRVSRA